jgi:glycosyl transferase family 25
MHVYDSSRKKTVNKILSVMENIKKYNENIKTNNKLDYPVYYINLDRNPERKEYMNKQLSKLSTNFKRIKGYNGSLIKNTKADTVENISFTNYYNLSKSEIGCTMSHLISIKEAYKNNDKIAMICEDDLCLETYNFMPDLSDIVEKAPSDWEMLQVYVIGPGDKKIKEYYRSLKNDETKYIKRDNNIYFWSTACYLINRKGMEKIVNACCKKDNHYDYLS